MVEPTVALPVGMWEDRLHGDIIGRQCRVEPAFVDTVVTPLNPAGSLPWPQFWEIKSKKGNKQGSKWGKLSKKEWQK
jgi:hypothetical protein